MQDDPNSHPQPQQPSFQQKYQSLLQEHQDLTSRIQDLQDFMCKCYTIKKNPRILDLEYEILQQSIAYKFNVQFQRISNENIKALQKSTDDKSRLQNKLAAAKQKQDKLTEQKKVLNSEKDKLNKKIEQMKVDIEDKNKRLENGRKKISTLETELSNSMSNSKKLEMKVNEAEDNIKGLRQKIKNKEAEVQVMETNYLSKIKELNQEIGVHKNRYFELEFEVKELDQKIKAMEVENKRKLEEMTASNEKKVRETIASYEREMDKKKKEHDSLYNSAAVRHERALKNLTDKSEQALKKLSEESDARMEEQVQKYKDFKLWKEENESALYQRVDQLQIQQNRLRGEVSDYQQKLESSERLANQKTDQYNAMKELFEKSTNTLASETELFLEQKQRLNRQIERILDEKAKELKAQDQIYKETMNVIQFDYQDKLKAATLKMKQENETAKNLLKNEIMDLEAKHSEEVKTLQADLTKIQESYQVIHEVYENKLKSSQRTYKEHTAAINKRTEYQKDVVIELKERQITQMKTGYETVINKYQKEFKAKVEEEKLLITIEKDEIIEKQKIFYEEEIKSLARSIEIAGNQKVMGVERKVKFVEKKLRDLEVEYQLIIKEKEILSKTSNTQLESMKQLQELFKEEIQKMQHRHNESQVKFQTQRYQYEEEITRLINEIEDNRREFQSKEELILSSCKARISKNETQMKEFGHKMKQQFEDLESSYNERYNILAKNYKQLQFLSAQKVSLPQDIEIIKVLHKGILEKEEEVRKQKELAVRLKKQLHSKEQANKIFSMKKLDSLNKLNTGNTPLRLYKQ